MNGVVCFSATDPIEFRIEGGVGFEVGVGLGDRVDGGVAVGLGVGLGVGLAVGLGNEIDLMKGLLVGNG